MNIGCRTLIKHLSGFARRTSQMKKKSLTCTSLSDFEATTTFEEPDRLVRQLLT